MKTGWWCRAVRWAAGSRNNRIWFIWSLSHVSITLFLTKPFRGYSIRANGRLRLWSPAQPWWRNPVSSRETRPCGWLENL